jgi:hypothetical protein
MDLIRKQSLLSLHRRHPSAPASRRSTARAGAVALLALLLLLAAAVPADADTDPAVGVAPVTVSLAGGDVLYTKADAGVLSQQDCVSGRFCIWSLPNFTGNLWQYSSSGNRYSLAYSSYFSYWNNRSRVSELSSTYAGNGGSYFCIPPGAARNYMLGWIVNAHSVYLASYQTSC